MAARKKKAKQTPEAFDYCVGAPWAETDPELYADGDHGVSVYAYGTQVHHGTMKEARNFRAYVNEQTGRDNYIYKLVRVPE